MHLFHASYGQRAENRGKEAVEKTAAYLGAKDLKFAEIPFLKELGGSSLTDIRSRVLVGEVVNLGKEKEMPYGLTVYLLCPYLSTLSRRVGICNFVIVVGHCFLR